MMAIQQVKGLRKAIVKLTPEFSFLQKSAKKKINLIESKILQIANLLLCCLIQNCRFS
jgi:hypothetical protein